MKKQIRESVIESYLRDRVRAVGGQALKWVSPGSNGVPDRIVLLPGNRTIFVELKAPGKKPTPLQLAQHRKIRRTEHTVLVIDSKEGVDEFIQDIRPKT